MDADNGAETINSDFVTMRNISLAFTAPRWACRLKCWLAGRLQPCWHCLLTRGRTARARRGTVNTQQCNGHHGLWAAASSNVLVTK